MNRTTQDRLPSRPSWPVTRPLRRGPDPGPGRPDRGDRPATPHGEPAPRSVSIRPSRLRRERNPYFAARPIYPSVPNGSRANITLEPYTRWYYPNQNSYYPPVQPTLRSGRDETNRPEASHHRGPQARLAPIGRRRDDPIQAPGRLPPGPRPGGSALRLELDRDPSGTLFLVNHSCWWDLFFVHLLNETIPVDGYGMMEHFNLVRFGFFRRIGAFSVDRTDPSSVRASLDYAAGLLRRPRAGVWVFPQGKIETNDARPIVFQPGIRALVRKVGRVRVVPVAFRYDFWQDERPEALVRFGEPSWVDRGDLLTLIPTFEASARRGAGRPPARLDHAADSTGFTPLVEGKRSVSERYAAFLARFRGPTPGAPD